MSITITVGILAIQGGVVEHLSLLQQAAARLLPPGNNPQNFRFAFTEVRTPEQLSQCDALIIPGGESTTMAIVAKRLGLLDPLRQFVKYVSSKCPDDHHRLTPPRTEPTANPSGAPAPA
jgi:5'-phosphate synthase pdxT subunit